MSKSKDFIFKEVNKNLVFVGDFEGFYKDTEDPWSQSATSTMSDYYNDSRARIIDIIRRLPSVNSIVEVGCGLGFVTNKLSEALPKCNVEGLDISPTAIHKAQTNFPNLKFTQADISAMDFLLNHNPHQFDVVLLNQLLWYILEELPQVMKNIKHLLRPDGYLLISNAFAREQRYGTHIIDHFDGAAKFFRQQSEFTLLHAVFYNDHYEHDDGHFLLQVNK